MWRREHVFKATVSADALILGAVQRNLEKLRCVDPFPFGLPSSNTSMEQYAALILRNCVESQLEEMR